MSYDFRLCLPQPGLSPQEIASQDEELAPQSTPPDSVANALMQRVAAALVAHDPALTVSQPSQGESARTRRGSADDVECERHFIELNRPGNGPGIQILIFDREAGLTVPYWHEGEAADAAFDLIRDYLGVMQRAGGYFVFDSQLGRVINPDTDFSESLACYKSARQTAGPALTETRSGTVTRLLFPAVLGRGAYFLRWCGLGLLVALFFFLCARLTMGSRAEPLVFLPLVAGLIVKMLLLDTARLRDIGWSPRLTFLSLFPPAAALLQLALLLIE